MSVCAPAYREKQGEAGHGGQFSGTLSQNDVKKKGWVGGSVAERLPFVQEALGFPNTGGREGRKEKEDWKKKDGCEQFAESPGSRPLHSGLVTSLDSVRRPRDDGPVPPSSVAHCSG